MLERGFWNSATHLISVTRNAPRVNLCFAVTIPAVMKTVLQVLLAAAFTMSQIGCGGSRLIPQGYPPPTAVNPAVIDIARLKEGPDFGITENFFVDGVFVVGLNMGSSLRINLDPGRYHFCLLYSVHPELEDSCLNNAKLSLVKTLPTFSLSQSDEENCVATEELTLCGIGYPDIFDAYLKGGRYCFLHTTPNFDFQLAPTLVKVRAQFLRIPCALWDNNFELYEQIAVN